MTEKNVIVKKCLENNCAGLETKNFADINYIVFEHLVDKNKTDVEKLKNEMHEFCSVRNLEDCFEPCSKSGFVVKRCGFHLLSQKKLLLKMFYDRFSYVNKSMPAILGMLFILTAIYIPPGFLSSFVNKLVSLNSQYNILAKLTFLIESKFTELFPFLGNNLLFVVTIMAPLVEDLVFRGITGLSQDLINRFIDFVAKFFPDSKNIFVRLKYFTYMFFLFFTTAVFSLMHIVNVDFQTNIRLMQGMPIEKAFHHASIAVLLQLVNTFILGILFHGYERKYGLDYSIIAHFFNNLVAVFAIPVNIILAIIGKNKTPNFEKDEEAALNYFMKKIKQSKKKISQSKKKTSKKI
jgi:membrane protease YdiL (CAAX protease family)